MAETPIPQPAPLPSGESVVYTRSGLFVLPCQNAYELVPPAGEDPQQAAGEAPHRHRFRDLLLRRKAS